MLKISLRRQLLIIAVLLFSLPLAVVRFAMELEISLREAQKANHIELAGYIARAIEAPWSELLPSGDHPILLESLDHPIILDGYGDDWETIPWRTATPREVVSADTANRFKLAIRGARLYLLLELSDQSVVYRRPGVSHRLHDQINLKLYLAGGGYLEQQIAGEGPGQIRAENHHPLNAMLGSWQETGTGSLIELGIPLASELTGMEISWQDIDQTASYVMSQRNVAIVGDPAGPQAIHYLPESLVALARLLTPESSRMRLLSPERSPLLEVDRDLERDLPLSQDFWKALTRRLLQALVDDSTNTDVLIGEAVPSSRWERPDQANLASLKTLYPLTSSDHQLLGWISLEKRTPQIAAVANDALFGVISGVFGLMFIVVLVLFGYASWLSWRIRTLRRDIVQTLNPEHRFAKAFDPSRIGDELGDLSRSFASMLTRLQGYSDYMETFASKLTHECRTPLAIVSSSLQLAEQADSDQERREYIERAQTGAARISQLLTAMRQATQLEASIQNQEKESFDLVSLLKELHLAYANVVSPCVLVSTIACERAEILGNPDLIAQAIDKLMENARDFTAPGSLITLGLEYTPKGLELYVENEGPAIPHDRIERLFDPFVSERDAGEQATEEQQLHLGLGLVIVRLVAEYHGGQAMVGNRSGGVRFSLALPISTQQQS